MISSSDATHLGIDIGGTKVVFALGRRDGSLVAQTRQPFPRSGRADRDLALLARAAESFLAGEGVGRSALEAVGVALPGPLDVDRGRVLSPPNLPGWGDEAVRDRLSDALGAPVRIENDANAAALAEWQFGAGRGTERMVYLTMSTGIGGGLILDGRLYRGAFSSAGEIGHSPVEWEGEPCACGRRGCLEAYIGGAALQRRFRDRAPASSRMVSLAGSAKTLRPEHWVEAARAGDPYAMEEMARFNEYLARGIAQLVFCLAPDRVVLGTICVAAGEALCLTPLRERLRALIWPFLAERLEVVPAALGSLLPAHAALCVAALPR